VFSDVLEQFPIFPCPYLPPREVALLFYLSSDGGKLNGPEILYKSNEKTRKGASRSTFWRRVQDKFYSKCTRMTEPDSTNGASRTRSAIKTQYGTINTSVGRFVDFGNLPRPSGSNVQDWEIRCNNAYQKRVHHDRHRDRVGAARRAGREPPTLVPYQATDNATFPYRAAWRVLSVHPKWCASHGEGNRALSGERGQPSMTSLNTMDAERPEGQKKSKERARHNTLLQQLLATCQGIKSSSTRCTTAMERSADMLQIELGQDTPTFQREFSARAQHPLSAARLPNAETRSDGGDDSDNDDEDESPGESDNNATSASEADYDLGGEEDSAVNSRPETSLRDCPVAIQTSPSSLGRPALPPVELSTPHTAQDPAATAEDLLPGGLPVLPHANHENACDYPDCQELNSDASTQECHLPDCYLELHDICMFEVGIPTPLIYCCLDHMQEDSANNPSRVKIPPGIFSPSGGTQESFACDYPACLQTDTPTKTHLCGLETCTLRLHHICIVEAGLPEDAYFCSLTHLYDAGNAGTELEPDEETSSGFVTLPDQVVQATPPTKRRKVVDVVHESQLSHDVLRTSPVEVNSQSEECLAGLVLTPGRLQAAENEESCTSPEHEAIQRVYHKLSAYWNGACNSDPLFKLVKDKYDRAVASTTNRPGPAFFRSLKKYVGTRVMMQGNLIEQRVLSIPAGELTII
jgi:hypothetical protein